MIITWGSVMYCGGPSGSSQPLNIYSCTGLLDGSRRPSGICRSWWTRTAANCPNGRGTYSFRASGQTEFCRRLCWISQPTVDLDSTVSDRGGNKTMWCEETAYNCTVIYILNHWSANWRKVCWRDWQGEHLHSSKLLMSLHSHSSWEEDRWTDLWV